MTPEERAREIVKGLQPWFGSVQDDLRDMMVEEIIAAALREARVEGARRMRDHIAALAADTAVMAIGHANVDPYDILADYERCIRALDPAEVVREQPGGPAP